MKTLISNLLNFLTISRIAILVFLLSFFVTSCKKESEEEKIPSWVGSLTLKVASREYCPGIVESKQVDITIDKNDAVTIGSGQISYSGSAYTTNLGFTQQAGLVSFNPTGTFDRKTGTLIIREHRITHDSVFDGEGGIALSFGNTVPLDYLYLNPIQVDDAVFSPVTILDKTAMLTDLEWALQLTVSLEK